MKKQLLTHKQSRVGLFLTLLLLGISVQAQIAGYTFTNTLGTYTPITGGTVLSTTTDDDNNYALQPIGFNFTYGGATYTTVGISANGYARLGNTTGVFYGNVLSNQLQTLSPLNGDLQGKGLVTSEIRIQTIGTAPSRVCVIQWRDWGRYLNTSFPSDTLNFQIRIREDSSAVEFVYGPCALISTGTGPWNVGVGINGDLLTDYSIRTGASFITNTAATANTQQIAASNTAFPDLGRTYRFMPTPMTLDSVYTLQNSLATTRGATNQVILNVKVYTTGLVSPLSVSNLNFNTNGSSAISDITNAKLYFTGTNNTFNTTSQYGSTIASPSGAMSFSGTQNLQPGVNNFWLTYDVANTAAVNNLLDAEFNTITINSTPVAPLNTTSPTGARQIKGALSGTYTIGATGNYTSITQALGDLSSLGMIGPVIFELTDPLYNSSTGEVFPITLSNVSGSNAVNTITLRTANLNTATITGNSASSIFIVEGAKYFTIDGRWSSTDTTKNLIIENTNTTTTANVIIFRNEASANTVRNTIIRFASNNTSTAPTNGAIFVGGTTNLIGVGNDSLTFIYNTFAPSGGLYYGSAISFVGQSLTQQNDWARIDSNWFYGHRIFGVYVASNNSGNGRQFLIRGNSFYDTVSVAPNLNAWTGTHSDIYMNPANAASWGHQIIGNYMGGQGPFASGPRQFINPGTAFIYTIWYNASNITAGARIANNWVTNQIYNQAGTASFYYPYHIYISTGYVDVLGNVIGHPTDTHSVRYDNNSGVCMYGIYMFHSAPTSIKFNRIQNVTVNSTGSNGYVAIYHSTTTIGEAFVDSNIVNRFFTRASSTSTVTCAAFGGMFISNSSPTHYIRGNVIGGVGVEDSISVFSSNPLNPSVSVPVTSSMYGIYNNAGIGQVLNNYVGNLYTNSSSTSTSTGASLVGIHQASGTGGGIVANNTVSDLINRTTAGNITYGITSLSATAVLTGNTVRNLTTNTTSTGTSTGASLVGIFVSSSQTQTTTNNTIRNLVSLGSASTQTIGIQSQVSALNLVRGNSISQLISNTTNSNTSTSSGIVGINITSSQLNQTVDSNSIIDLVSTNNGAAVNPSITGIAFSGSSTVIGNNSAVTRNRIWGLTHTYPSAPTPTGAIQHGINISNGTVTVANNLIRLGRDSAGVVLARPGQYRGIISTASSNQVRIYHNNVLIDFAPDYGAGGTPNPSTGCLEFTGNAFAPGFIDVRNNIFANTSVNAGTSTLNHYNEMYSTSNLLLSTNTNILFNSGSSNSFVARWSATNYATLNAFRAASTLAGASGVANPGFVAPLANSASVNIQVSSPTPVEGMGDTTLISFVSNDVNGLNRSAFGPVDIGASAGNYTLSTDSIAPLIYYTALTNTSSPAARTFTATLYDGTGFPIDTAFGPRVYYKNSTQLTWVNTPGTFVSGSIRNRVYSFTIDHALLGGLLPGDVVQYYVLAADTGTGNINSNPAYAIATNTGNVTTHPAQTNSYLFNDPVPTVVYLGTGAGTPAFTSLTGTGGLFSTINNSALQGNTLVLVQSNVTEPGTVELNKWLEVGTGGYQLTIRPVNNTQYILSGTATNSNGMIRFNNTDNVRILGWDTLGTVNDTNLIIRSSSTSTPAVGFVNGGSTDTLQNVILESRVTGTTSGVLLIPTTSSTATRGVSNVFVNNCWFRQDLTGGAAFAANGIYAAGTSPRFNSSITVNNSKFANFTQSGVFFTSGTGDNIRITNNHFYYNYGINTSTSVIPINFTPSTTSNSNGNFVTGNFIGGRALFADGLPWTNNASVAFTGISLNTGTASGTVVNNNIIQNINFTSTTNTSTLTGIFAQGISAVYTINNNRIGSTVMAQSILSNNNGRFIGINTTTTGNVTVQNDTIMNIQVLNTGTVAALAGIWSQSGSTSVVNISNNIINNLFTTSSNTGTANTTCALIGIATTHSTLNLNINNNTIRSLVAPTAASTLIRGIWVSSGTPTLNGNTVFGIQTNSTAIGTLTTNAVTGIASTTTFNGQLSISNNTVDSVWRTGTLVSSQMIGIQYNSGGTQNANVSGNVVRNLNLVSSSTGTTTSSALVGLYVNAAATVNSNYNDNRISVLNHLSNAASNIVGMYMATSVGVIGNNSTAARNLVHSLGSTATTAVTVQTGILNQQGFVTYANNMVRMGIDSSGTAYTNPAIIRGIWHVNAAQAFYYHNSVLIGGQPSSGSANTFAFDRTVSITSGQQIDLRNNIFANIASNAGTASGFHFGTSHQDSLRTVSNFNIIYTPGTGGIAARIAQFNTNYASLGGSPTSYKSIVGLDMTSSSADPGFGSAALAAAPNVDLSLAANTPAERSGDPTVTVVTTDYFANSRSSLTPTDVGAHAGNFNMIDAFPPTISYTPLTNAGSFTGTRSLTNVTITDNNGIVMSGANRPRIYYSRTGSSIWYSSGAVTVTGTSTNAVASFSIDYLSFSPALSQTDTIRYFVVAQDAASNLQSFPALATGTNVNSLVDYPLNPFRYSFLPVIAANTVIPVGAGQTYTSLTNAGGLFEFINNRTLGGNVFVEITSDITNETGAVQLNKFAEDGPGAGTFTLTIRPDATATSPRTVQGNFLNTSSVNGLITLIGADRVKFTGIRNGGSPTERLLRFRNVAATGAYAANTGNAVFVVSSASGVVMRNLIVESGNSNTAGGSIEFRVGNNSQFLTTPCSFDTVTNCILTNNTIATLPDGIPGNAGIYSFGQPNVYNNNIVITNNQISNFVVAGVGVVGNNGDGFVITGNSFFYSLGFVPNITGTFQGIVFLGGSFSSGNNMSNNFIGGSAPNCGGTAWTNPNNIGFYGIRASVGNGANSLFNNNTVQNLAFTNNAATQLFTGIRVEAGNAVINNNQIGHPTNTNSILWSTGGTFYGIHYFGVNNVTYQNNNVQGINMNVANVTPQFIGLYHQNGSVVGNISGNTIGHNTTANSISIASNTTHYGMFLSVLAAYSPSYTVSNNTIANMTATATGTGGLMYGMLVTNNAFPTIANNTVHNLRSASISTSTAGIAAGIVVSASSATNTVINNTVYAIRGTNTGATPSSVHGIYMTAGQDNIFRSNRVYDITSSSTSTSLNPTPTVAGIAIAGASNQIYLLNNQITLGTGMTQDIQIKGVWLFTNSVAITLNAYNNSIVIDGAATSGIQNTYGYLRGNNTGTEINTYNNFRNNIIVNRRTGGTGFHYALSNQASSPSNTTWLNTSSAYNLLSTANVNAVGEWGLGNNNLANWRNNTSSDILSYYVQAGTGAGQLNINNLFTSIATGNLGLNTSNAEVWYAYGKGITGSEINNLNIDFSGNARSTTQGIATTIGSAHMTSAPTMLPIAATASAAPASNTTTVYTFANRPVASINWGTSAPTSATVYDFTGVNPPSSPAGNFNNCYIRADISGGTTPYNYGLVYNFDAATLGTTINANNIRLATSDVAVPTAWTTQFTTTSNSSTGIASVGGLSSTGSFITFTGTELAAPPTITVVSPSAASIGAAVTIRGTLFTGASAISFNGVAQTVYTVVNDTIITTTVPAGATTGPIQITNSFGTGTSAFNFTVIPAPTIASFSPTSGTFGSAVTITGTGFTWATGVRFNGQNAAFTVVNNTTINTTVPAGATTGNIRVTNGTDSVESSSPYTVFPAPTVSSFTPSTGPAGTTVTITGTDFNAVTNVRFNGVNSSFTVNSTTTITATVPAGASTGAITVVNGSGTGTSGTNFTVTLPPTISGFSPSSGGVGSTVVITGSNFTGATAVSFNGTAAASYTVNSSSQITAVVATGTTTGNIIVVTPSGADTSVTPYTVIADLVVSTAATVSGTYNTITVTGTGVATLGGTLTALGNTVIQTGGTINFGTEVLSGIGSFTAQSGSRLIVGSPQGLEVAGITGNIQVNGARTINAGARVEYSALTGNQNTGNLISNVDTVLVNLGSGDLILNTSLTVNRHLEFITGSVRLGANNLTIGSTGSIVNASSTNYVKTNGIGSLNRTVQNNSTNVSYPVGSLTSFTPAQVQLNGSSTTDVISVRVFNGVLVNGNSGLPLATSMVDRTWAISESVAGGSNATITLTWNSAEEVGGFNRTQSAVSRYNTANSKWTYVGTSFGAATGTDPYSRSISGVSSLSFFTVGDSLATALPVNLIAFEGKGLNEDVLLTWTTASEQNNRGFSVERSADGENFTEIKFVNGKEYSVVRVNYELLDEGAFAVAQANTLYYRLRQIDFDGTETLSSVVSVNRDTRAVTSVKAYPNPFNTGLQVEVVSLQDADYTLTITDIQGRVISTREVLIEKGMNRIAMDELDNLKGGIYFVRLNGTESTTLKVVKTN
ncbi:MAG: IPT/TIG domain-containing protein [Bacteroidota bacterium]